jgi:hypothetical protein
MPIQIPKFYPDSCYCGSLDKVMSAGDGWHLLTLNDYASSGDEWFCDSLLEWRPCLGGSRVSSGGQPYRRKNGNEDSEAARKNKLASYYFPGIEAKAFEIHEKTFLHRDTITRQEVPTEYFNRALPGFYSGLNELMEELKCLLDMQQKAWKS